MAEITIEKCQLCGAEIEKTTFEKEGNKIYIDCKEEFKRKMWIPCSEKLPDGGKDVIVYTKAWEEHIQIAHIQYDGIRWELADGEFYFSMSDVTHWMPLPEPPESEEKSND